MEDVDDDVVARREVQREQRFVTGRDRAVAPLERERLLAAVIFVEGVELLEGHAVDELSNQQVGGPAFERFDADVDKPAWDLGRNLEDVSAGRERHLRAIARALTGAGIVVAARSGGQHQAGQ